MQKYSAGLENGKHTHYFDIINIELQQSRDIYHKYLYSVTCPHFVPGVNFKAEDLYYIPCNGPLY